MKTFVMLVSLQKINGLPILAAEQELI
jgi:hypothetical protein